jgi:hypothetical protein
MGQARTDPLGPLRSAVARQDGAGVVVALAGGVPPDSLQLAGDGLLIAVAADIPGSHDLAATVSARLRDRDAIGDEELADQLDAALGLAPAPMLRPLPVDLEDLSMSLEGDPLLTGGRIDLRTGDVINEAPLWESSVDGEEDDLDEPDRWLRVDSEGSRDGYDDMVDFLGTIDDERLTARLADSLHGRGVFRRFRDRLGDLAPDELERFRRWEDDRKTGRARAWLAAQGYRPVPRP